MGALGGCWWLWNLVGGAANHRRARELRDVTMFTNRTPPTVLETQLAVHPWLQTYGSVLDETPARNQTMILPGPEEQDRHPFTPVYNFSWQHDIVLHL